VPRIDIPVTTITRAATAAPAEVVGDSVNDHSVANDGKMWLTIRNNGSTVTRTATALFAQGVDGEAPGGKPMPVPLSATRHFGPFPVSLYGSTLNVDADNAELRFLAYRLANV
jgi:hypothetical protein